MKKSLIVGALLVLFAQPLFAQQLIQPGVPVTSNTSLTVSDGTRFALPQTRGQIITWQTSFTVAPTLITLQLQFSLDNVSYFGVDSSTSTTGELKYLGPISARFVRCAVTAVTVGAGSGFQCKINILAFNNPAIVSGGTLTSPLLYGGTAATPGLAAALAPTNGFYWANNSAATVYSAGGAAAFLFNASFFGFSSGVALGWATGDITGSAADVRLRRTGVKTLTLDDGAGGAGHLTVTGVVQAEDSLRVGTGPLAIFNAASSGQPRFMNAAGSKSLILQVIDTPSCTSNCGTSPTVTGVGSSFTLTMGATGVPASGFVITFATAWAAAPQCTGTMAKAGMVVGKLPLTLVTTTTTLTVVTNGTAPATTDIYHFHCSLGQ